MAALTDAGIHLDLPPGWEGEIRTPPRGISRQADGAYLPVVHIGNFPLPAARGDFGSGAVEIMNSPDVLIVLFEYDPREAGKALFSHEGLPIPLQPSDFDRNSMQRPLPGQSGAQRFFRVGDRALCLYVVLGSHTDRGILLPQVNDLLASIQFS